MRWITAVQVVFCVYLSCFVFKEGCCCEHGWLPYGEYCIRIYLESVSRWAAKRQCLLESNDLISFPNESDLRNLTTALGRLRRYRFWVGLPYNQTNGKTLMLDSPSTFEEQVVKPLDVKEMRAVMAAHVDCFTYHEGIVEKYPCSKWLGFICGHKRTNHTFGESCKWRENGGLSFIGEVSDDCLFTPSEKTTKDEVEQLCQKYEGQFVDPYDILKDGSSALDGSAYWTDFTLNDTYIVSSEVSVEDLGDFFVNGTGTCVTSRLNYTNVIKTYLYQTECDSKAKVICSLPKVARENTTEDGTVDSPEEVNEISAEDTNQDFIEDVNGDINEDVTEDIVEDVTRDIGEIQAGNITEGAKDVIIEDTKEDTKKDKDEDAIEGSKEGTKDETDGDTNGDINGDTNKDSSEEVIEDTIVDTTEDTSGVTTVETTSTETPENDTEVLSCPHSWRSDLSERYCYWATWIVNERLPWNEAEMYCRRFGGHLASFHSSLEEEIGLSFQYGSYSLYPYWIGLKLDPENETYVWSDGTPIDYTNWEPGNPDHKDKRLRCVAMKQKVFSVQNGWVSIHCGFPSLFICRAPIQASPPSPIIPTPTPLEQCRSVSKVEQGIKSYFFDGDCYFTVSEHYNWYKAKQYCEKAGTTLVSIHSVEEVGFLLKLLYESNMDSTHVWIGLNALLSDESLRWTDWTPVDFTYFNNDQPNNFQIQKCYSMYDTNALWNQENCNAVLNGFICKRRNDTSSIDPTAGNCKKGWIPYHDRCYILGGRHRKELVNWTDALDICRAKGGFLTSIRDEKDQSFLSYLLQILGTNAWIGLHDTTHTGRYDWIDNSYILFKNWITTDFNETEDCVMMFYNFPDTGQWKAKKCDEKMGFICYSKKDPKLPKLSVETAINCQHIKGWLKLHNMCFKMFDKKNLTWQQAENTCKGYRAHLVSMSDIKVYAVLSYITAEMKKPFWIGLQYKESTGSFKWLNGWSVTVSKWENNESGAIKGNVCIASTPEGYWKKFNCTEKLPYVCQLTTRDLMFKESVRTYYRVRSNKLTTYTHVVIIIGTTAMFVVLMIAASAIYVHKSIVGEWFNWGSCLQNVNFQDALQRVKSINFSRKDIRSQDKNSIEQQNRISAEKLEMTVVK